MFTYLHCTANIRKWNKNDFKYGKLAIRFIEKLCLQIATNFFHSLIDWPYNLRNNNTIFTNHCSFDWLSTWCGVTCAHPTRIRIREARSSITCLDSTPGQVPIHMKYSRISNKNALGVLKFFFFFFPPSNSPYF